MKGDIRRKSDGISNIRTKKRTRREARSFPDEQTSISLTQPLKRQSKKRQAGKGIRRKKRVRSKPIETKTQPEALKINEQTFTNNRFYTPPKRYKDSVNYIALIRKWLVRNKKITYPLGRLAAVWFILFLILNARHSAHVNYEAHIEYQEIAESLMLHNNPQQDELGFDVIALSDEESTSIIANESRPVRNRARGEITIFNNFSSEPQRLLPETRFESASGKIFKLDQNEVIIPGKNGDEPGSISATVYAEEAGDDYNIDITDFTIPGFQEAGLSAKYDGIYAVSTSEFSGGSIGTELYLSQGQQEEAEELLQSKLFERLELRLTKEKTDQVVLIDNTASVTVNEPTAVFDDSSETGVISQRGTIIALVVSRVELEQFVNNNYLDIPEGEQASVMENYNFKLSRIGDDVLDYENIQNIEIEISGNPLVIWEPNDELLKQELSGLREDELIPYFKMNNSLDRVQVDIRPFWKNHLPENIDKILLNK
ncbi:MAG: hypothetical protein MRY57_02415 [Candidatus Pacebacteria bacterium]|nr:hypothetical protein [Candidatus Paceibacterota bacterium]